MFLAGAALGSTAAERGGGDDLEPKPTRRRFAEWKEHRFLINSEERSLRGMHVRNLLEERKRQGKMQTAACR